MTQEIRDFAASDIRWGGLSPVDLGKQAYDYANGDMDFATFVLDYYRDEPSPDYINLRTAWFAYQR